MEPAKTLKKHEKPERGIRVWWIERRKCWGVQWYERREGKAVKAPVMRTRKTKSEALALAGELAATRRKHGTEARTGMDAKGEREWDLIRETLLADKASVAQLLGVWSRHKAEVLGGEAGLSVADAVKRYLELLSAEGVSPENYARYEMHLERLSAGLGTRGLLEVGADELRAFFANLHTARGGKVRKAEGWTLIHHQKSVRALFARARVEGWRGDDPMERLRPPEKPREEVEFLSVDDGVKLFTMNRDNPISLRLALEAFAGLRYSGSGRLEAHEVNYAERTILIPATKSKDGKRHLLDAIPENAWAWLERWRDDARAWAYTPRQHNEEKSRAFARAGVVNTGNVLRHSFCTYHVAQRKDAALTAVLMQHTNPSMLYRHYRGAATAVDAGRWFSILPWAPLIPEGAIAARS